MHCGYLVCLLLSSLCFTLLFFAGDELFNSYMGVTVVTVTRQTHPVCIEIVLRLWVWIWLRDF